MMVIELEAESEERSFVVLVGEALGQQVGVCVEASSAGFVEVVGVERDDVLQSFTGCDFSGYA